MTQQTLHTEQGQRVVAATAEPGSPSANALVLLSRAVTAVGRNSPDAGGDRLTRR